MGDILSDDQKRTLAKAVMQGKPQTVADLVEYCSAPGHQETIARYQIISGPDRYKYCPDCFVAVMTYAPKGKSFTVRIL